MPTISQLPSASSTNASDVLPIDQAGTTRSVTVAELLSGTQPTIEVPSPSVLGRASLGPGSPESLSVGVGLVVQSASIAANGTDHATFPVETSFQSTDRAIINASGVPMQLPIPALRALFSAGTNVAINPAGAISASTDPGVSNQLQTLSQGLSSANGSISALTALIPPGGVAGLNSSGQVTAPIAGDATLGTVKAGGVGVPRTLGSRALDVVNLLDFGAVAGGPDCTSAFAAAFAELPASGGEIFIPAGDYWISTPLVFTGKPVVIGGAGRGQTRLHFQHTGIGFDFVPNNLFNKILLRHLSFYAESLSGQTQSAIRITYPATSSFGYVTAILSDLEFFSYPNSANGKTPFPQTFQRGMILNNCWATQIDNISFFGPPAPAGTSTAAAIEVNESIDTRISGAECYYGNALVIQTGYCEGIYIRSPLVVGSYYLFNQTNETTWPSYKPNQPMLLGLWVTDGEVNTNIGTAVLNNVNNAYFANLDVTRDSGPNTAQTLFLMSNVTKMHVSHCNVIGGPGLQDIVFSFSSTYNSSDNFINNCHFEDLATVMIINGGNGTVGLVATGLHLSNVPIATALIDQSAVGSGNIVSFRSPQTATIPAGIGSTTDFVWTGAAGQVLHYVNNVAAATNHIRCQPSVTATPPSLCFDGSDSVIHGVLQTKGGNLYLYAGGASGNGNLATFFNTLGSSNWVTFQNATGSSPSIISTNAHGLSINPSGALTLSSSGGIFATGLPTTKPAAGSQQLWNNNGVVSIA